MSVSSVLAVHPGHAMHQHFFPGPQAVDDRLRLAPDFGDGHGVFALAFLPPAVFGVRLTALGPNAWLFAQVQHRVHLRLLARLRLHPANEQQPVTRFAVDEDRYRVPGEFLVDFLRLWRRGRRPVALHAM